MIFSCRHVLFVGFRQLIRVEGKLIKILSGAIIGIRNCITSMSKFERNCFKSFWLLSYGRKLISIIISFRIFDEIMFGFHLYT